MRTTVDIDSPVLAELKALQRKEGKSLGRLVSDLLAQALRQPLRPASSPPAVRWIVQNMGARVDLSDRDALYAAMDQAGEPSDR